MPTRDGCIRHGPEDIIKRRKYPWLDRMTADQSTSRIIPATPAAPLATTVVEVDPVVSQRDARAFCALPYTLYRDDPNWVAPLRLAEQRRWSPRHNASLRSRWTSQLLARRRGQVVGRIAAIVDPAFSARWGKHTGFFGFFECIEDQEVASALFRSAEQLLGARGVRRVFGPVNLTTHDEVGFLVHGFDTRPMMLCPYNPPYYPALATAAGYRKVRNYHAHLWTAEMEAPKVAERLAAVLRARQGRLAVRPGNPDKWDNEMRILWTLYNAAFSEVWGFVPISLEEFSERASAFKRFYRPELILIAEIDGQPSGFAMILPDVNEALAPLNGRLFPLGWLRLLRGLRKIRTGRLILLGVDPAHVGRGLSAILLHELIPAMRRSGLVRLEVSLIGEDNEAIGRIADAFAAPIIKTYALYEKRI